MSIPLSLISNFKLNYSQPKMALLAEISDRLISTGNRAKNVPAAQSFAVALLSITIGLLSYVLYLTTLHPLRKVPGPWLAKLSPSWQNYHAASLQKAHAVQSEILSTHLALKQSMITRSFRCSSQVWPRRSHRPERSVICRSGTSQVCIWARSASREDAILRWREVQQ